MRFRKAISILLATAVAVGSTSGIAMAAENASVQETNDAIEDSIINLKTEGMVEPLGIDQEVPHFSWQMVSDTIGASQKTYQIVVKDAVGNVVWDSGEVKSAVSNEVEYEGDALLPCTRYEWSVSVRNQEDEVLQSETASFETAFMDTTNASWDGAQMIGAPDLALDAASQCIFNISAKLTIPEGSEHASFILGADDYRLKNKVFNVNAIESDENYVRVELDISEVGGSGAKVKVYRTGYTANDSVDTPVQIIEEDEKLNEVITPANKNAAHAIDLNVSGSKIAFFVDDVKVGNDMCINDLGNSSSYNSFPNLNKIGFAANPGEQAFFEEYQVENTGRFAQGVLFGQEIGATYEIFNGLDGITVEGQQITVDGGENGILQYADPTYSAAPMLRKEFEVKGEVASARLYITAEGIYNFYMNGREVAAEEWYNPGCEEYDAYLAYNTYDVTDFLKEGTNAMGAELGEGWWTGQMTFEASNYNYFGDQSALMAKMVLNYADGTSDVIVTDESWSYYGDGPIRLASFFQGERYDATKEADVEGWKEAGFDGSSWSNASLVETRKQFQNAQLVTRTDTPVHVIRVNPVAQALGATKEGTDSYIYDMGENVSGVPTITIPAELAKEGETLTIRYAEILYPDLEEYTAKGIDGTLMVENYRAALVTDFYTMKEGENVFTPDLTSHGYRYIEITGLGEELPAECIAMNVLSSLDATGTYVSSNELTNQLYKNIVNSTTSNYISIPTDCPQRNERMGWTGDAQIFALTGSYVADTYNFLDVWMDTVRADSGVTGMSSQFCPAFVQYAPEDDTIEHKGQSFGITWNCLAVTIPYNLYMQTGRKEILEANKENIYAYVDTLASTPLNYKDENDEKHEDARLTGETGTLADHLSRVITDGTLLGEAVYYNCLNQASEIATVLGDADKAQEYQKTAEIVKEAWNEMFIISETGETVSTKGQIQNTQASYATPLRFGIVSDENLEKVLANYAASITEASGEDTEGNSIVPYTMTTGFNATGNLLNALSMYGMNDIAYQLFESTEYASWLYPVTQGATSIWERWNSYTNDNGFGGNNSMNSFNHYSFGAVGEWMMGYQLGIMADHEAAGYQHFILQPTVGGTFTEVKGSYESVYGTICSGWTASDGKMTSYDVTVPANTSATLYLPVEVEIPEQEGVTYAGEAMHNGITTQQVELLSGKYHFEL
ncbi:MAG: family 78 glycoside hydrolase catalytic domain [Blautia sp.]|nr:family 78 glycoside hydrolase catalytic domain [Blautia sp.]